MDIFLEGGQSGSPLLNGDNKIVGLVRASDGKGVSYGFLFYNETVMNFINSNIK